jgi:DNA-binding CsgD family transcriptional regulator
MVKTPMYRQFMRPRDWHYGMAGVFWVTETSRSVIALLRGKAEGPCKEPDLSLLRMLVPHLRRAAQLHGELTSLRSQRSAFTDHLDRYPQAFILADAQARVLFANAAAKKIASSRDGLRIEAGRLMALSSRENAPLHKAIREIAAAPDSPRKRLAVTRSSQALPYQLLLMPIQSSRAVPLGVSQPAVAILIIDSETTSSPDVAMLRDLFALTAGEARVVAKLVQGRIVEEVAADLDISVLTARTHIRRVLSKTATNRQGELIALVLRTIPSEAL